MLLYLDCTCVEDQVVTWHSSSRLCLAFPRDFTWSQNVVVLVQTYSVLTHLIRTTDVRSGDSRLTPNQNLLMPDG